MRHNTTNVHRNSMQVPKLQKAAEQAIILGNISQDNTVSLMKNVMFLCKEKIAILKTENLHRYFVCEFVCVGVCGGVCVGVCVCWGVCVCVKVHHFLVGVCACVCKSTSFSCVWGGCLCGGVCVCVYCVKIHHFLITATIFITLISFQCFFCLIVCSLSVFSVIVLYLILSLSHTSYQFPNNIFFIFLKFLFSILNVLFLLLCF